MSDFPERVKPPPLETPYAEIAVDVLNVPADKTYHYAIPEHLRDRVAPGVMVLIGFGERIIEGLVVAGAETSPVEEVREIMDVVADSALLTPTQITLARKIARYYLVSPMKVIAPMLPPGLRARVRRWSVLDPCVTVPKDVSTTESGRLFLEALRKEREVSHKQLAKLVGREDFKRIQRRLERIGAVQLRVELAQTTSQSINKQWVERLTNISKSLLQSLRSPQQRIMQALEAKGGEATVRSLLEETDTNLSSIRALEKRGFLHSEQMVESTSNPEAVSELRGTRQRHILQTLEIKGGQTAARKLLEETGASPQSLRALEKKGLVRIGEESAESISTPEVAELLALSPQEKLLQALEKRQGQAAVYTLLEETGANIQALRRLEESGLVLIKNFSATKIDASIAPSLPALSTPTETYAWETIAEFLSSEDRPQHCRFMVVMDDSAPENLYCHAVARTLKAGRQVLLLTPGIHATRRVATVLRSILPNHVLEWHPALREARRGATWERVHSGEPVVVVGTRTAVFLPFQGLGQVLVDNEHEDFYKNPEIPRSHEDTHKSLKGLRFHAVTVADWLAESFVAPVLLFSHTPRVTTYAEVESGRAQFARATGVTPTATIIDMRSARHVGPRQIISRDLRDAITRALEAHRPVVLLQNRRGAATNALCPKCGHVVECLNCSVPLVQHRASGLMRCHRCGAKAPIPTHCPKCETQLRFRGIGSQTVEIEIQRLFPAARIARWDRDVIEAQEEESPYAALREGKLDILIGTAAVLAEPLPVGLYAVVSADTALHLPDFRSAERTYQLLRRIGFLAAAAQAEMLVQTYTPDSLPLRALKLGRYLWFYRKSMAERTGAFPPSVEMAVLLYQDRKPERAAESAVALVQCLQEIIARDRLAVELLGPAPAFPERVRGLYRWHVLVRGQGIHGLLVHVPPGWIIDVDPVSVL